MNLATGDDIRNAMNQSSGGVAEQDPFTARLEEEMHEFRLAVIGRVCAARGIKASRDDCASALVAGEGRLSLAVVYLSERWHSKWSAQRVMSAIRRVFGIKN